MKSPPAAASIPPLLLLLPPLLLLPEASSSRPSVVLTESVMSMIRESAVLSSMAYDPSPNSTGFSMMRSHVQEPDRALVAKRGGYCYAAFRGTTMTWDDWSQNFHPGMVDACVTDPANPNRTRCCTTRHGFYEAYMTDYHHDLEREMRECAGGCSNADECVVLTGHSQGGAIAALAGLYLSDLNPYVITFGQPLTIDAPCDMVTSERWYRFINTKFRRGISYDPIPFVPGLGADSFGHMVLLSDDTGAVSYIGLDAQDYFGPLDVRGFEAHSMIGTRKHPGYLDRIEALIGRGVYPVRTYGYRGGSPCTKDVECESNDCAKETRYDCKRCVDTECTSDLDCNVTGRCDHGLCLPKLGSCEECDEDSDCAGGRCLFPLFRCSGEDGLMDDKCWCIRNTDCASGRCEGVYPPVCEARLGSGARCNEDSDCRSGRCGWGLRCEGAYEGEASDVAPSDVETAASAAGAADSPVPAPAGVPTAVPVPAGEPTAPTAVPTGEVTAAPVPAAVPAPAASPTAVPTGHEGGGGGGKKKKKKERRTVSVAVGSVLGAAVLIGAAVAGHRIFFGKRADYVAVDV